MLRQWLTVRPALGAVFMPSTRSALLLRNVQTRAKAQQQQEQAERSQRVARKWLFKQKPERDSMFSNFNNYGFAGGRPDEQMYGFVIEKLFAQQAGDEERVAWDAMMMLERMKVEGTAPSRRIYKMVIEGLEKTAPQCQESAREPLLAHFWSICEEATLKFPKIKTTVTHSKLALAAQLRDGDEAKRLISNLEPHQWDSDLRLYALALDAVIGSQQAEDALEIFERMLDHAQTLLKSGKAGSAILPPVDQARKLCELLMEHDRGHDVVRLSESVNDLLTLHHEVTEEKRGTDAGDNDEDSMTLTRLSYAQLFVEYLPLMRSLPFE